MNGVSQTSATRANVKFVGRVTLIHIVTYILCGIVFAALFDYEQLFTLGNTKYFMREVNSSSSLIGPLVQIIRGILFGLVLLLFRGSYEGKRYGWLRLWAIIVIIGIINTPGPAPFSIEGLVYTQLPLEVHLKGAPEILVQTLLFSWLVAKPVGAGRCRLSDNNRTACVAAIIGGVGFAVGGLLLALTLGVDPSVGTEDPWAFIVMLLAVCIVFFMTRWYAADRRGAIGGVVYYGVCYMSLAVLPTVYNFITGSTLSSYWSLLISALPLAAIAPYVERRKAH